MRRRRKAMRCAVLLACTGFVGWQAAAASAYNPITPLNAGQTVMLDGKHLTVDQVVSVARYGAKVQLTPAARQRSLNAYYLLLEGSREGIPIYFFNRGAGSGRQTPIFFGDPLSTDPIPAGQPGAPNNRDFLLNRQLTTFRAGARQGLGPEVNDEEIVRAMMVVRANTMVYEAATPQTTQMLLDLLNKDVTPVVESRGSPGEGDLPQMGNVEGTMVGAGDAYLHGVRMSAAQALAQAGLQPLQNQPAQPEAPGAPFAADDAAVVSNNAFSAGQASLLLYDSKQMLNWSDLVYATALNGMNSSVTPIASIVQNARPFPWQNFVASRVLNMIAGSYLFNLDQLSDTQVPIRIIQDPESLRATSQRNGSAWQFWDQLKRDILIQINSSDHNPAVLPGSSPSDSPELNTPWFLQYYVKGGPDNTACVGAGCQHGYILSNSNWEPISWDNDIEAFTNAVANMDAAAGQVIQRFTNTFFTVIGPGATPTGILSATEAANAAPRGADYTVADLTAEIQTLVNPVPAQGNGIVSNVEDLQAESRIKVAKARLAVDDSFFLLGQELLTTSYWLNVRQEQGQQLGLPRPFGAAPTAAWNAFRQVVPWQMDPTQRPNVPPGQLAYAFLVGNPAATFFPPAAADPRGAPRSKAKTAAYRARLRAAVRHAKSRTARVAKTAKAKRKFLVLQARHASKR
jgi:histidine ammonia-lyase